MLMTLECPRCQQGHIRPMRIISTRELIWVCEECEASWASHNAISKNSFEDYGTAMKSKGLNSLWSELEPQ